MQLQYENPKRVKGSFVWRVNSRFLSSSELKGKLGSSLEDPKLLQKLIKKYGNKLYLVSGGENKNKFFVELFSKVAYHILYSSTFQFCFYILPSYKFLFKFKIYVV